MIHVRNVSKLFRVIHNRESSLKSKFVRMIRARRPERVEDFWALKDVSFTVRRGETLAVLGRNGSGKSTLLRVISGIYPATTGSVEVEGAGGMGATLELGVGFHPDLTGDENLRLSAALRGLSRDQIEELTPRVVAFSELGDFMDVPMKFYSSGMYMRLAFSLETCLWPDALLVDEALSVGDAAFKEKCNKRLLDHK